MTLDPASLDPANPFAAPSALPYALPDFAAIRTEHYLPAFEAGMAAERAEMAAVATDPAQPTEENTLLAIERAGQVLHRVATVFFNRTSADTTPELDAIEAELAPRLAEHHDAIYLDERLYHRLTALDGRARAGEVELPADSAWLLENLLRDFVRAGVTVAPEAQEELRGLNTRISSLETAFSQLLLAETNASAVHVTDVADLTGMPEGAIAAAAQAATDRGLAGWLVELILPSQQPALADLADRDVRRRLHEASVGRGGRGGEHDTRATLLELARLRARRAAILGHPHHASYVAEGACARTTQAVTEILTRLAGPAAANARRDAVELEAALRAEAPGATLEAWDWARTEQVVRRQRFALDESALRPYLELNRVMQEGVFAAATGLYGLTFARRTDLVGYLPEVEVYEVFDADGSGLGLFLVDFYTRESKQGGAWMNNLVDQSHLFGLKPVVVNNHNIPKPPAGEPTLLTWDEVITLFHEFGHALHGLLSDVRLPSQSGTEVPRDFVEYPSQVNEMWAWDPAMLARYAVHHVTGEPIPAEWVATLVAARQFGEGFKTTEYLAAAILDQAWHTLAADDVPTDPEQVVDFEAAALERAGVAVAAVPPRYRSTYFNHTFGGGYDAGYYSYIWSEVLDADTGEWFAAHGGLTRENGERFRRTLLSRGESRDVMDSFRELLGRDPRIEPLVARRGLTG